MINSTIEQQKEFEKMMAEINRLHQENDDLIKENREREQRDNNIKKNLIKEIDKLKKEKLKLIKENEKLSCYKDNKIYTDEPDLSEYKNYYNALLNNNIQE